MALIEPVYLFNSVVVVNITVSNVYLNHALYVMRFLVTVVSICDSTLHHQHSLTYPL